MISHLRSAILAVLFAIPLIAVACDKVPLLAPTGTVITLIPESPTASLNSSVNIIATVIENGTGVTSGASTKGAGTPVQNGTVVNFTTTLGSIEPAEARTHNGQVTVRLVTGNQSGTATITAYSGGTSAQKDVKVGTAAAGRVTVTATPQTLGSSGGTSVITAVVTDDTGRSIAGVPVTFSTTKGTVTPTSAVTDANGVATATLTTSAGADVTVSAGAQSGKVTVNVNARAGVTISSSTTNPTAGAPVTFAVSVATSANVNNVRVDFGDGSGQDLGPLTGSTNVAHNYSAPGSYRPTATAFPAGGDPESVSTTVNVGAMSVTVTGPGSTGVGTAATFTATPSSGTQVDHFTWTYDDGTVHTTTGNQDTHIFNSKGTHQVRVDVFAVGGAQGTASTAISIT